MIKKASMTVTEEIKRMEIEKAIAHGLGKSVQVLMQIERDEEAHDGYGEMTKGLNVGVVPSGELVLFDYISHSACGEYGTEWTIANPDGQLQNGKNYVIVTNHFSIA